MDVGELSTNLGEYTVGLLFWVRRSGQGFEEGYSILLFRINSFQVL